MQSTAIAQQPTPTPARVIAAACVGNALEWYDIAVYSFFATYLARAFFPSGDPATALLLTLGTFAVSFLVRPVGALVLGGYADRRGRTPALTLSLGLMVLGTLLICVMPTYGAIGVLAPIGILVARLVQGFAAGGEFGSATALMVEHLPDRRGFAASWQFASQGASSLLAASLGTLLTTTMSDQTLDSWGFRLPFVVGLLVGPVGIYVRRRVPESPSSGKESSGKESSGKESSGKESSRTGPAEPDGGGSSLRPVREVLAAHKRVLLLAVGALGVSTCLNYLISFIPTYSVDTLGLPGYAGFVSAVIAAAGQMVITPFSGHLSDRLGRLTVMRPVGVVVLVVAVPAFVLLVAAPGLGVLIAVVLALALLQGAYLGPLGALLAELLPARVRATGMAISYNIGVPLFGGFTPLVAQELLTSTGIDVSPSFWVVFVALIGVGSLTGLRRWGGVR